MALVQRFLPHDWMNVVGELRANAAKDPMTSPETDGKGKRRLRCGTSNHCLRCGTNKGNGPLRHGAGNGNGSLQCGKGRDGERLRRGMGKRGLLSRLSGMRLSKDEVEALVFALLCLVGLLGVMRPAYADTPDATSPPSSSADTSATGVDDEYPYGGATVEDDEASGIGSAPSDGITNRGTSGATNGDGWSGTAGGDSWGDAAGDGVSDAEGGSGIAMGISEAAEPSGEGASPWPQTGLMPVILIVLGLGMALGVAWLFTRSRKPKKLGGSKGDVW